jgi:hypothetical protein
MPIADAQKTGAMMLFGGYGDDVRVLDIGTSRELRRAHVAPGDRPFRSSAKEAWPPASGAWGAGLALDYMQARDAMLTKAPGCSRRPLASSRRITQLLEHARVTERELARLKTRRRPVRATTWPAVPYVKGARCWPRSTAPT